jgi:hypothetical protein
MHDFTQVHALIPRPLKRQAFVEFARQEQTFSHWLREALERWLEERQGRYEGMHPAPQQPTPQRYQEVTCDAE